MENVSWLNLTFDFLGYFTKIFDVIWNSMVIIYCTMYQIIIDLFKKALANECLLFYLTSQFKTTNKHLLWRTNGNSNHLHSERNGWNHGMHQHDKLDEPWYHAATSEDISLMKKSKQTLHYWSKKGSTDIQAGGMHSPSLFHKTRISTCDCISNLRQ